MPGPPALSMADTYAVVQRRAAPVGTGAGAGARARSTEDTPLYSQVTPRAWRQQARAEDARGAQPGRGKSRRPGAGLGWIVPHLFLQILSGQVLESLEAAMTSPPASSSLAGARPGGLRFGLPWPCL